MWSYSCVVWSSTSKGICGDEPGTADNDIATLLLFLGLFLDLAFFSFAGRLAGAGSISSPEAGTGDLAGLASSGEALFRSIPLFFTAFPARESAASSRSIATLLGTA